MSTINVFGTSRGAGAQSVTVKPNSCGPTRGDEIFIQIYISISSLWYRGKALELSSAIQHGMPPELGRKWGTECLTLGFLCLPCCVRDTA